MRVGLTSGMREGGFKRRGNIFAAYTARPPHGSKVWNYTVMFLWKGERIIHLEYHLRFLVDPTQNIVSRDPITPLDMTDQEEQWRKGRSLRCFKSYNVRAYITVQWG